MAALSRIALPPPVSARAAALAAAVAAGLLLTWTTGKMLYDRWRLPPGPVPLPVLGNLMSIGISKPQVLAFTRSLRRKYGDVVTIFFGPRPIVVLNGYEAIYEALVKNGDKCHIRCPLTQLLSFAGDSNGMIMSPHWKDQRKASLETLREHGMGKIALEEKIQEELVYLFGVLDAYKGNTCTIHFATRRAIANIICNITFGSRFEYDDATYTSLLSNIVRLMTILPEADLKLLYPVVAFFPGKWREVDALKAPILSQLDRLIEEKSRVLDVNHPGSYVDSMLALAQKKGANSDKTGFSKSDLVSNVFTLVTGGMDTTDSSVRWALLHLLVRADVQESVYREIADKIGTERLPSVRDRQHMPYTEAFITEVLRLGNPATFTLPYILSQAIVVAGRRIPAGTLIFGNIDSASQDESLFAEPEAFKPERHLDASGNYVKSEKLIPFSIGRRSCLGEALARMELFLFITSLVQRYKLLPPADECGNVVPLEVKAQDYNQFHVPYLYECRLARRT